MAMHNNVEGARLSDVYLERGVRLGANSHVPADNHVLSSNSPFLQIMDPAGAIDVLMPVSNAGNRGLAFIIGNISANAITLKTSGDAAFTTAIVIAGGESTLVYCTGHATAALGWRALATAAST